MTRLRGNVDEPVRRHFVHAIDDGAPPATRFRYGMTGRIRVGRPWLPFSAEQELAAESFEWKARVGRGLLRVTDRSVSWRYGSDRATPFFTARLRDFAPA